MSEQYQGDIRDTSSLDHWLSTEFREQYDKQYKTLNKLGLLDILPKSGEMGIIGIDNKEYPIPGKEVIEQEIRRDKEKYETNFRGDVCVIIPSTYVKAHKKN